MNDDSDSDLTIDARYAGWLGPATADLTQAQHDAFVAVADNYYALPLHAQRDPDDQIADVAEDDRALTAILQGILHEDSLMSAARRARDAEDELIGWIRAEAAAGVPERTIEEQSGLSRTTVRKRLGK